MNALATFSPRSPHGVIGQYQRKIAELEAEVRELRRERRVDQLKLQAAGLGDDGLPVLCFRPWLLHAERTRQGLSLAALAACSGFAVGALRLWEEGVNEPSWRVLYDLAQALETETGAFLEFARC